MLEPIPAHPLMLKTNGNGTCYFKSHDKHSMKVCHSQQQQRHSPCAFPNKHNTKTEATRMKIFFASRQSIWLEAQKCAVQNLLYVYICTVYGTEEETAQGNVQGFPITLYQSVLLFLM